MYSSHRCKYRRSLYKTHFSRFDQILIEFIINAANSDLPLRLPLLKVKVFEFSQKYAYHKFKSRDEYVRLTDKNNIKHIIEHGEANSVLEELLQ